MSKFFNFFGFKQEKSANLAKERLKIIVAHDHERTTRPDFLPKLQQDLVEVISKYVKVSKDQVQVALAQGDENSTLELNISLPNTAE